MPMTATTDRNPDQPIVVQLTPNFWSLILSAAIALVAITVNVVTRPDEQKVQRMIDASLGEVKVSIVNLDEKVDDTHDDLDRIEEKIDKLSTGGFRR